MNDKVAIVTGASRGIGAAIANTLGDLGFVVGVNYLNNAEQAVRVKDAIIAKGGHAFTVKADVRDEADIKTLFHVSSEYGALSVLVNNAGISGDRSPLEAMSTDNIESVLKTNIFGPFLCVREAITQMKKAGAGNIINVTSEAGTFGGMQCTPYSASKAAMNVFTKAIAREVAEHGIRVNGISPGVINTSAHDNITDERRTHLCGSIPLKRMGDAKEVASVVKFLISDDASYLTGTVLPVHGGR